MGYYTKTAGRGETEYYRAELRRLSREAERAKSKLQEIATLCRRYLSTWCLMTDSAMDLADEVLAIIEKEEPK